jgi:hypothetical protein
MHLYLLSYCIAEQMNRPNARIWIAAAFFLNCAVAGLTLAAFGVGIRGTSIALQMTARLAFLFFLMAYLGSPLAALFGTAFQPVRRRGREFGLAFAAALAVHLLLITYLCFSGAAPPRSTFIFFGAAAVAAYLLALFSITGLQRAIGQQGWRILRFSGMNFIAYAFAVDFVRVPISANAKYLISYLPFAILSLTGPVVYLAAYFQKYIKPAATVMPAKKQGKTSRQ